MIKVFENDCLSHLRIMDSEQFDAVITDPPYGIDFQSNRKLDPTKRKPKIANDKQPFIWFLYDAFRVTKENGALVCFCRWDVQDIFKLAIEAAGYTVKSQVIWNKGVHGLGDLNAQFAPQHEIIWFATKGKFKFQNGRPKSVITTLRVSADKLVHPNEKPLDLMRYLVRYVTPAGGSVLDPFAGSGSTLLAAQAEDRQAVGIELDPNYAALIRNRLASPVTAAA